MGSGRLGSTFSFEHLRAPPQLISATAQPFSTLCYELDDFIHKSDVQLHRQSYAFNSRG